MKTLESIKKGDLWPLVESDVHSELSIANRTLAELQKKLAPERAREASLYANAWVALEDWRALLDSDIGGQLVTESGDVLAFIEEKGETLIAASAMSKLILHPWDLLDVNEQVVASLTQSTINGEVSSASHIDGVVQIGEGTRILPGVYLEGNVVIGNNCKIGPNCYIRGNTSIGNDCRIGNAVEIKNSIIGHGTSIGHLSYVGDSVIGSDVNFGAVTVTSNLRHDGNHPHSMIDGRLIDTCRSKLGAIVGNRVHTGIHTAIYPGRKLGAGTFTRPSANVICDIRE